MASIFETLQQFATSPEVQKAITGAASQAASSVVQDTAGVIGKSATNIASSVEGAAKRIEALDLEGMQEEYYSTMKWAKAVGAFTVGAMVATMVSCYFSYKISRTQQRMLELSEEKMGRKRAANPRRRRKNQHRGCAR